MLTRYVVDGTEMERLPNPLPADFIGLAPCAVQVVKLIDLAPLLARVVETFGCLLSQCDDSDWDYKWSRGEENELIAEAQRLLAELKEMQL